MTISVVDDVVKVRQGLFCRELSQKIHIAIGLRIGRENVMVRNNDHVVSVPHLCLFAKLAFEHADSSWPAHIVRHENVRVHPNVIAGLHASFACSTRQNFLSQRHMQ